MATVSRVVPARIRVTNFSPLGLSLSLPKTAVMKKSILYFAVFIIVNIIVSYGGQGIVTLIYGQDYQTTSRSC